MKRSPGLRTMRAHAQSARMCQSQWHALPYPPTQTPRSSISDIGTAYLSRRSNSLAGAVEAMMGNGAAAAATTAAAPPVSSQRELSMSDKRTAWRTPSWARERNLYRGRALRAVLRLGQGLIVVPERHHCRCAMSSARHLRQRSVALARLLP